MTFAVNVDPRSDLGAPDPEMLFNVKFRGIRHTSFNIDRVKEYGSTCQRTGLKTLAIITGESGGFVWDDTYTPDIIQIGNEPDAQSTYMTPTAYADMYVLFRTVYPDFKVFGAGLASGGENALNYWREVTQRIMHRAPLPDAIAIHPYVKNHIEAAADFDMMWNEFQIPIIATEWYVDPQTNDMWDFVCMLNNPEDGRSTLWNSWFCWTDAMEGPFGLVDKEGIPKPEHDSLLSAPCLNEV